MLRIRSGCCAPAPRGHPTAAPPSTPRNSRRFMSASAPTPPSYPSTSAVSNTQNPAAEPPPQNGRSSSSAISAVSLFDHLFGAGKQHLRHVEAEGLGGLEVDRKLELVRRLHRQVCRLLALEDAIDVAGRTAVLVDD